MLNFLLEDLVYWVSTVLEDVNQVHNLLLSQLEVRNLIGQELTLVSKLGVRLHYRS